MAKLFDIPDNEWTLWATRMHQTFGPSS
jgi:hypothetical protein